MDKRAFAALCFIVFTTNSAQADVSAVRAKCQRTIEETKVIFPLPDGNVDRAQTSRLSTAKFQNLPENMRKCGNNGSLDSIKCRKTTLTAVMKSLKEEEDREECFEDFKVIIASNSAKSFRAP